VLYVQEGDDLAPFIMEQAEGLLAERFDQLSQWAEADAAEEYNNDNFEGKYI